jgi:hypothetical protein
MERWGINVWSAIISFGDDQAKKWNLGKPKKRKDGIIPLNEFEFEKNKKGG